MTWKTLVKSRGEQGPAPNLRDYAEARKAFSWEAARSELGGLPGGRGLNIAHEAVDRHAAGPRAQHLAIRWLGKGGAVEDLTYERLRGLSNRFANVLLGLGVRPEERVYALTGRIPALYIAALGRSRTGASSAPSSPPSAPSPSGRASASAGPACS